MRMLLMSIKLELTRWMPKLVAEEEASRRP